MLINLGLMGVLDSFITVEVLQFDRSNSPSSLINDIYVLVCSSSLKSGKQLDHRLQCIFWWFFFSPWEFIASQSHSHSPMCLPTPNIPSFMSQHCPSTSRHEFVIVLDGLGAHWSTQGGFEVKSQPNTCMHPNCLQRLMIYP